MAEFWDAIQVIFDKLILMKLSVHSPTFDLRLNEEAVPHIIDLHKLLYAGFHSCSISDIDLETSIANAVVKLQYIRLLKQVLWSNKDDIWKKKFDSVRSRTDIIYRSTCLPVHLAAGSWLDSFSNSCRLDCTDRRFRVRASFRSFPLEFTVGWPSLG